MPPASNSSSAIAPAPASRAINRERSAITCNPSARLSAPATTAAVTSPIECPITASGVDPIGPPQLGQRQLHPDQHRLNPLDTRSPAPRRPAPRQREPGLRNENRLQLGHRRGERRLIGQQLPAHPRPLRTLPRIHEHRARPARPLMRATPPPARPARPPTPATPPPPAPDHRHTPWRTWHAGCGDDSACAPPPPTPPRPRHRPSSRPTPPPRRHPLRRLTRHHQRATPPAPADTATGTPTSGACSITTCAFVPPKPNDDTPARRGRRTDRPLLCFGNDFQTQLVERDVRIGRLEVQVRRNVAALHRQHRLDETRDPGRRLQMTQIRLHGADQQR